MIFHTFLSFTHRITVEKIESKSALARAARAVANDILSYECFFSTKTFHFLHSRNNGMTNA
ncbi:hypothetical protein E6C60_0985 [Paenibacillus algicola]|uniref:Uncharacterized protein n=1 Tax=Paenibacillus algicola TaxID=2565926 RepID=A0A4P8XHN3_9BACL|nr:hypothetical protein E6C60_0985 [Paenibacillus algicola]